MTHFQWAKTKVVAFKPRPCVYRVIELLRSLRGLRSLRTLKPLGTLIKQILFPFSSFLYPFVSFLLDYEAGCVGCAVVGGRDDVDVGVEVGSGDLVTIAFCD